MDGEGEPRIQSFVVKVWFERSTGPAKRTIWRGRVTHIPTRERRYVRDLDGLALCIATYLERMGVRTGVRWRLRGWLYRARGGTAGRTAQIGMSPVDDPVPGKE